MKGLKITIMLMILGIAGMVVYGVTYRESPSFTIAGQTQQASAAQSPTDAAVAQVESDPEKEKSRLAIARDAYLDDAIQQWNTGLKSTVCSRKLYYYNRAQEWARQTGGDVERWFLDRLEVQVKTVSSDQRAFTGLTGDPDQNQTARNTVIDQLALMLAAQDWYQGRSGKDCVVNLAIALEQTGKFQNSALTFKAYQARYQDKIKQLNGVADAGTSK